MDRPKPVLFSRSIVLLIATLLLAGANCHGTKSPQVPNPTTKQVIIKFKSDLKIEDVYKRLSVFEKDLAIEIEYVRPMSGDAHVVKISLSEDELPMEKILQQLNDYKDVEYAEEDSHMQIQTNYILPTNNITA